MTDHSSEEDEGVEKSLSDLVTQAIAVATGTEDPIFLDGYILVAAYSGAEDSGSSLMTWWSDTPKWKLLGMSEGLSAILRQEVVTKYTERED